MVLALASTVGFLMLAAANGGSSLGVLVAALSAGVPFAVVGALILSRRPANAVGWILAATGVLWTTGFVAEEYAEYAYATRPGAVPRAAVAAWYGEWFWIPAIYLIFVFMPLLFPTGRPPTSRWRAVLWLALAASGAFAITAALERKLEVVNTKVNLHNPIGLLPIDDAENGVVGAVMFGLLAIFAAAALSAVFVRFRRSAGDERQQLKWFTYAATALIMGWFLLNLLEEIAGLVVPVGDAFSVLIPLLPVSVGIAVFKHRLYDIDVIINRTLVYALLSAALGLLYLAGVVGAGSLIRDATGEANNDLVVAASTLAIAALFRPLRARIQAFIDRRFYRRKYDASRMVEALSQRLRNEVHLEAAADDLVAVVRDALQPAHVSLWLRG
jgi:hypothetical protein